MATDQLPVSTRNGAARVRRVTWASTTVRVLELPPGAALGHLPTERAVDPGSLDPVPVGLCRVEHWGLVLEGGIEVRFAFGERESVRAGELFYWPGLHTCWSDTGVRYVEFSPAADPPDPHLLLAAVRSPTPPADAS